MTLATFKELVESLNAAGVRYLVAGGVAVNAHGYLRFTADVDLVIALEAANVLPAFAAFGRLGYRPVVPVTAEQFADPATRARWTDEKGMTVLNFFSDRHPETSLDVFVQAPFDFDAEHSAALVEELAPGIEARFVSIPALIRMKEASGRPRDLDDIEHLRMLQELHDDE